MEVEKCWNFERIGSNPLKIFNDWTEVSNTRMGKFQDLITSIALVAILLSIGLVIVGDYGPSWDELSVQWYTQQSFAAYGHVLNTGSLPVIEGGILNNYGPAYFLVSELVVRVLNLLGIGWQVSQWHIAIFLSFILSVLAMYFLARRSFNWWPAFSITLLFVTQPLLWGHAFINPKDIPFMAFFLATVTLGLWMMDRFTLLRVMLNLNGFWRPFYYPPVLLAAFFLGFTTSICVFGLYAGFIVMLYSFTKSRKGFIKVLPAYLSIALVVSILTWPYLWESPLMNFIRSVRVMSSFPWNGFVLFRGSVLHPSDLPRYFYPLLMSIQLTEPLVILAIIGFFFSITAMMFSKKYEIFFLIVVWFFIPLFAVIFLSHTWYNNFRQVLFLLPPVFLSAGLAIDKIFDYIKSTLFRIIILVALIMPGVYSLVKLHPYQYVYFNSFAGGVNGASRNYELDYWAISYRAAANYLNQVAPSGAKIIVFGPEQIFGGFMRSDLKVIPDKEIDRGEKYDFAVLSTSNNDDLYFCPTGDVIHAINADAAPLTVIKMLDRVGQCP